jgi:integrase
MAKKRNTKLPKIKQLPSGAYHCKVSTGKDENGKTVYLSITDHDYNTVVLRAAEAKADRKQWKIDKAAGRANMSLYEAIGEYIEIAAPLSSPATIRSYRSIHRNCLQLIMDANIDQITQDLIIRAINQDKKRLSIKTVKNVNSLLCLTLQHFRPDFTYKINLNKTEAKKQKKEIKVPSEEEVRMLMEYTKGTKMEIPIILASCLGMRPSEISALRWDDFDFDAGVLTISRAVVRDSNNKYVEKGTKTEAGTRTVRLFPLVLDAMQTAYNEIDDKSGYICISPSKITDGFAKLRRDVGIRKDMRFYDLRHYVVSVMLSLNIPKKYIADYVGHENEKMIDEVYGHIMARKKTSVEDVMYNYFSGVFPKK